MNRRVWIKQTLIAGGGLLIIPACLQDAGAVSVLLKNIKITAKEETLFAELTEAILPQTNTPGAKSLNLHQFVLKMFDDCYSEEDQKKLVSGLRKLNNFSEKNLNEGFTRLPEDTKLEVLNSISAGKAADDNLKFFLAETKNWVIKGYNTCEYFSNKIIPYELVPGRFHGCVTINNSAR
jgi:hypothetical protein